MLQMLCGHKSVSVCSQSVAYCKTSQPILRDEQDAQSIVATNSGDQLRRRQLAGWFYDRPLAMYPMRFNAIEPRAFYRQPAKQDSHSALRFCLSVLFPNPIPHFATTMPRGII